MAHEGPESEIDENAGAAERRIPLGPEEREGRGQGHGELLSRPGSDHGTAVPGPGQELSAGEG